MKHPEPDFSASPDSSEFSLTSEDSSAMAAISGMLPAYEIVQQLHRGGQGVVYKAIHKYTNRFVAIKVMAEGPFAGEMHRARFQREAKILAHLKHPNIVAIQDTGIVGGYHYFVMDLIDGRPLVDPETGPTTQINESLARFVKVCEAVNAAHLLGIIHRDLKPDNIHVDESGEPFVFDFGLAKHDSDDTDRTLLTTTGQFLGSMPWASPEQVEAHPDKIDLRTDVYALGVVLYQMLTDRFPYGVQGTTREVLDNIVNAEPTRPSTHRPTIDEEVETIVMRCLQKDPARRYQNAGDLARDIERYLSGEPIEAKRDSMSYVVRKQLYRYRVQTAVAAMFCVVTLTGMIVSLGLWSQAEKARQQEVAERERFEVTMEMLGEMISTIDPYQHKGSDYKVREMLDEFVPTISERAKGMPAVEAELRQIIAEGYHNLEEYPKALEQSDLALGAYRRAGAQDTLPYAQALSERGWIFMPLVQREKAEVDLRAALALMERLEPRSNADLLETRLRLAKCLATLGKLDEVDALLEPGDLLADYDTKARTEAEFEILHAKVYCLARAKRYEEERELLRKAIKPMTKHFGENHIELGWVYHNLADLERKLGNKTEARKYYEKTLAIKLPLYGEENPRILAYKLDVAFLFNREGKTLKAFQIIDDVLDVYNNNDLELHFTYLNVINKIARQTVEAYFIKGSRSFAESYWTFVTLKHTYETRSTDRVTGAIFLSLILDQRGKSLQAQELVRKEILHETQESSSDTVLSLMMKNALAYCMRDSDQIEDAKRLMSESTNELFTHSDAKPWMLNSAAIRAALFYRFINLDDEARKWESLYDLRKTNNHMLDGVAEHQFAKF